MYRRAFAHDEWQRVRTARPGVDTTWPGRTGNTVERCHNVGQPFAIHRAYDFFVAAQEPLNDMPDKRVQIPLRALADDRSLSAGLLLE
ncbi:hypothetical protein HL65_004408 [Salmonella enterica]|nr:hypothetical protein [Salmonella enterica]